MNGDIFALNNSGNAGELSWDMDGQTDHEKYYKGLRKAKNVICRAHGTMYRRSGSRFSIEVKDSAQEQRLLDFTFSADPSQSYILEMGDYYIRFHTKAGVVLNGTVPLELVSPWTAEEAWQLDYMQTADEVRFSGVGTNAPQVLIRTGHTDWDLAAMDFRIQGYDLTIPDTDPLGATGLNGTTFTLPEDRVFEEKYIVKGRNAAGDVRWFHYLGDGFFKADGADLTITFTDVEDVDGNDVDMDYDAGEIEAIYDADGKLNSVWDVLTSDDSAPEEWASGNWPSKIGSFEGRLILGATPERPLTYWGSRTDQPFDFRMNTALDGTPLDDDAFEKTLTGKQVDPIQWIEDQDDLLIGTSSSEFRSGSLLSGEPTTPSNVAFKRQSKKGSKAMAKLLDEYVVFASNDGTCIHQMRYDDTSYKYLSPELTLLARHAIQSGIKDWDFANKPDGVLWCVRNDGEFGACTSLPDQNVYAWHRHELGGNGKAESVACIPGTNGDQVWLLVRRIIGGQVKRYIEVFEDVFESYNSVGERREDARAAFFVDSGLSYDEPKTVEAVEIVGSAVTFTSTGHGLEVGDEIQFEKFQGEAEEILDESRYDSVIKLTRDSRIWINDQRFVVSAVTDDTFQVSGELSDNWQMGTFELGEVRVCKDTVSGLDHLEGETIQALGDGGYLGEFTVVNGTISLERKCARVHAGYGFSSKIQPMRLEYQTAQGTMQTKTKRFMGVTVRFRDTISGRVGVGESPTEWELIKPLVEQVRSGQAPRLQSKDIKVPLAGDTETDGLFMIMQDKPLPMTVVSVVSEVDI